MGAGRLGVTADAGDNLRVGSLATMMTVREADLRRIIPGYGRLSRLGQLKATCRAIDAGLVQVRDETRGSNKVLLVGITKLLNQLKDGTPYRLTHVDIGTSGAAVDEAQTGTQAHVDAAVGKPRISITTKEVSGKILRTSSFIAANEYVGSTLREACLFDAASGGTAYNRVLFSSPLAKTSSDTAICNIDHTINN